jgi:hypothetical protein
MRKKFKNEIFNYLNDTNLGKDNFDIEESIEYELSTTSIIFKDSPLKFIIRTSAASYDLLDYRFVTFSPEFKMSDIYPSQDWAYFTEVFDSFKSWINNHVAEYVEELQIPDLWSEYKKGNKTLRFNEINFENRENFSFEEKEQIKMAINELKLLIHKNMETSDEEQQLVNNRLDYLIEAMNRLNKFDWKSVAISTTMSISIALTLDTSKGQLLFDLFRKVFSIIPMLIK